jgi:hypothetical protein
MFDSDELLEEWLLDGPADWIARAALGIPEGMLVLEREVLL